MKCENMTAHRKMHYSARVVAAFAVLSFAVTAMAAELGRIGVTVTDLGNPFFVRIARGVENAARKIVGPGVKVYVASSAYDL